MSPQPGQTLLHYRLDHKIGEGGMGAVYRAFDTKLDRPVALKVLPEEMAASPDRLERFRREAKAIAALNHPHIVTLYSVEEAEGTHFLTMELVEGTSLDRMITPGGLPLARVFDIGIALSEALAAAHERGVVHRDLKPANVMVTQDGRIKVLDFGLAKLAPGPPTVDDPDATSAATVASPADETLTEAGTVMGTAPYMSPEQLKGLTVDHRTDIFALGVMLYEMCAGRRPFAGDSSVELISSILRDSARPVTELRQDLPRHLGRIVAHCLEKELTDRYQSALDVRNELRALRKEVDSGLSSGVAAPGSGPAAVPSAGPSATISSMDPASSVASPAPPPVSQATGEVSAPVSTIEGRGGLPGWLWAVAGAVLVLALLGAFWLGTRGRDSGASSAADAAGSSDVPGAVAAGESASLAVLPFADRSPTGDQEYFTDGLSEELMNALGRIPDLRVAGRTSSFAFKGQDVPLPEIGEQLNVAHLLEGSVRKASDQIRVSVQLVKADDGFQLWSETYDRTLDDIFSVQDDIAQSVAEALQVTLLGSTTAGDAERPDAEAYDLVLKARFVMQSMNEESVDRARALLEEAIARDPDYAPAWAEMGLVHAREMELASFAGGEGRIEAVERANAARREALLRALELDPDLAVAHSRLAAVQWQQAWDFAAALRSTERALAADPTNPVVMGNAATLYGVLGRSEEAIRLGETQLARDPLYVIGYQNLGAAYWQAGLLDKAGEAWQQALVLEPERPNTLFGLCSLRLEQGRLDEASELCDRFLSVVGNDPSWRLYVDAFLAHYAGEAGKAAALMEEYEAKHCDSEPSACATFYALRERPDEAFAWLEKSYDLREPGLPSLRVSPDLANLRGDPRWEPFWREVGFPDE